MVCAKRWMLGTLAVVCVLLTGCAAMYGRDRAVVSLAEAQEAILVLPPVTNRGGVAALSSSELGKFLHLEVAKIAPKGAVYAGDIPELGQLITPTNLLRDGSLCCAEIGAMGRAADCDSVVASFVRDYIPYAPQRIVVELVWVSSEGGLVRSILREISLEDPEIQHSYRRFVLRSPTSRFRSRVGQDDRYHLAELSPVQFQKFAAAETVAALMTEPKRKAPAQ